MGTGRDQEGVEVRGIKIVTALLGLLIVGPIWYYLLYQLLVAVNAREMMWFLYWIYVPVAMLIGILSRIVEIE